ncbi:MAG: hypothetical protein K1X89_22515 [Myxococcaceae bacterium]|nr:hypothetical protein [Myxococcaceae bacterium]
MNRAPTHRRPSRLACLLAIAFAACGAEDELDAELSQGESLTAAQQVELTTLRNRWFDEYVPTVVTDGGFDDAVDDLMAPHAFADGQWVTPKPADFATLDDGLTPALRYDERNCHLMARTPRLRHTVYDECVQSQVESAATLAQAYLTHGSRHFHHAAVVNRARLALTDAAAQIEEASRSCGFDLTENSKQCGNWFGWMIGTPGASAKAVLLLRELSYSSSGLPLEKRRVLKDLAARLSAAIQWKHFMGEVPRKLVTDNPDAHWAAANLTWNIKAHLTLGIAERSPQRLAAVRTRLNEVLAVKDGAPGIQSDGSMQMHGRAVHMLYVGGYGSQLAFDVADDLWLTAGTAYQPSAGALRNFVHFTTVGGGVSTWGLWLDPSVAGRHSSHGGGKGHFSAWLRLSLASFGPEDAAWQPRVRALLVHALAQEHRGSTLPFSPWERGLTRQALAKVGTSGWPASTAAAEGPEGFFSFPVSDYAAYRRSDFFASVKLHSPRTAPGERINSDGHARGARQSDGRLLLSVDPEWMPERGMPTQATYDWLRIPGITVLRSPAGDHACIKVDTSVKPAKCALSAYQRAPDAGTFVGSVTEGETGVAAMDFMQRATPLKAKKSWFFLDGAVVSLAAGVRCRGCVDPVETVVGQWPARDGQAPITLGTAAGPRTLEPGVEWAARSERLQYLVYQDLGAYFFGAPEVTTAHLLRTGCKRRVTQPSPFTNAKCLTDAQFRALPLPKQRANADRKPIEQRYLTVWHDHGNRAGTLETTAFAWAAVPHADVDTMKAWAAKPPVAVLSNTAALGAVSWHTEGPVALDELGAAFFQPGTVQWKDASGASRGLGWVHSNAPVLLSARVVPRQAFLAVSDPTMAARTVKITVGSAVAATPGGCLRSVSKGSPAVLELELTGGRSCRVTLTPAAAAPAPLAAEVQPAAELGTADEEPAALEELDDAADDDRAVADEAP